MGNATADRFDGPSPSGRTRLVLLGTCGGPFPSPSRSGIAQAVVVGDRLYLVDCGSGVARQLVRKRMLPLLHTVFLTHLHSDHDVDYFSLFLLTWSALEDLGRTIHTFGPGSAGGVGALPGAGGRDRGAPVCPEAPTPGLIAITERMVQAHAYDLNIRQCDAGRSDLTKLIVPHEIEIPTSVAASSPNYTSPPMEPFKVYEDDRVKVSAILVDHPPVFPSFAYRFDADEGSIVVSGDTAPCVNLVRLAQGADILVHEVCDVDGMVAVMAARGRVQHPGRIRHLSESHTSIEDVGRVATECGAKTLVLTHFIPSTDIFDDDHWVSAASATFDGHVIAGRDLMEVVLVP